MRIYTPKPIDTSDVSLPDSLVPLTEKLAENIHEVWAAEREKQGWSFGPARDDAAKLHPCFIPYSQLPESEKEFDRKTAVETILLILKLGYGIQEPK